jgi:hypothetical protein
MRSARTATKSGWRHGPPWGAVVLALLVLGLVTVSIAFDSSLYAEIGARSTCRGSAPQELGGDPEEPVTVKVYEDCESSESKVYTFTGPRREAGQWTEQTLNRLAAEREAPALRSKLSSIGSTLGSVGLGLTLAALALGAWRAIARTMGRRDRAQQPGAAPHFD